MTLEDLIEKTFISVIFYSFLKDFSNKKLKIYKFMVDFLKFLRFFHRKIKKMCSFYSKPLSSKNLRLNILISISLNLSAINLALKIQESKKCEMKCLTLTIVLEDDLMPLVDHLDISYQHIIWCRCKRKNHL